ncbi:hypothetical protein [Actinokineospora enzanensis]|uniref:hypothetical protein n=1 Tax=Actinokineospora enzanensis TaxID=155975 RepID=UPI000399A5D5|nr:hypothetical protein [Actinokineospora enzanensis]
MVKTTTPVRQDIGTAPITLARDKPVTAVSTVELGRRGSAGPAVRHRHPTFPIM